jgi:N6-adenosine-specific RNA methylase IME4
MRHARDPREVLLEDIKPFLDNPKSMPFMRIRDVKVGIRHRHEMGDIDSLARSMGEVGLLHPIVVTKDGALIAGKRRLEAARQLGWTEIRATVVDLDEIVRGEFAENAIREDFRPSEIEEIRRTLQESESAKAKERQIEGGRRGGQASGKFQEAPYGGETLDKIGAFAGKSGRTVRKIADVVQAAEREPEKFGHLVQEMDRTGKVNGAYRKLRQAQDEKRISGLTPRPGRYRTLVIDPPWDYGQLSLAGRATPRYATLSHNQLLALPVEEWAEDECHLYLWTTNNFLTRAGELMAAWGFDYKTVLTWSKPRWGLGSYFRHNTEQVLFGVRGALPTRADNIATLFEAPRGIHSEKPERFYEIVRTASYLPAGEAFQRTPREHFVDVFEGHTGEFQAHFPDAARSLALDASIRAKEISRVY